MIERDCQRSWWGLVVDRIWKDHLFIFCWFYQLKAASCIMYHYHVTLPSMIELALFDWAQMRQHPWIHLSYQAYHLTPWQSVWSHAWGFFAERQQSQSFQFKPSAWSKKSCVVFDPTCCHATCISATWFQYVSTYVRVGVPLPAQVQHRRPLHHQ